MEVKRFLLVLMVVFEISMSTARPHCPDCPSHCSLCRCPQETVYFSNLATPFPAFIESIDYNPNCHKPCGNCGCDDQLILPPMAADLPCGLGYFPSASPLVAKYYAPALDFLITGAYIPISSPCDSLILAAPVSPEIAPLVKPIIL